MGDVVPREPRSNPDRPGRGTNPKYVTAATNPRRTALNDHYDDPTQCPEYGESYKDRIIPDEDYRNVPLCVEQCQLDVLQKVEYIMLGKETRTTGVTTCQGCRDPIKHNRYFVAPMNLVFRYKMYQRYCQHGELKYSHDRQWGYFHAEDMCCIRNNNELRQLNIEDVYMSNCTFLRLSEGHMKELECRGHLEPILNTRRSLRGHR